MDTEQALEIVAWLIAGEARSSSLRGYTDAEVAEAITVIEMWDQDTRACSGAYTGYEDDEIVDAASWIYERRQALRDAQDRLRDAEHEAGVILRQLRGTETPSI